MDWNALITSLGNSIPVIVVLGYAWMREAKRADIEADKRDHDNKSWADRYAELAHQKTAVAPPLNMLTPD